MKYVFLLLSTLLFSATLFAQTEPGKGEKGDYSATETEVVSDYRIKSEEFTMPGVVAPIDDPVPVNRYEKTDQYLADGKKVYIDVNPSITTFIQKHKEIVGRIGTVPGYRVQVFIGIEREPADKAKGSFVSKFPGVDCYMKFIEPSYRIRVGNFTTRIQAENFCKRVRATGMFDSAFVVREEDIIVPKLKPIKVGGDD